MMLKRHLSGSALIAAAIGGGSTPMVDSLKENIFIQQDDL